MQSIENNKKSESFVVFFLPFRVSLHAFDIFILDSWRERERERESDLSEKQLNKLLQLISVSRREVITSGERERERKLKLTKFWLSFLKPKERGRYDNDYE